MSEDRFTKCVKLDVIQVATWVYWDSKADMGGPRLEIISW